jgi:4-amino-4-deoxy-L-arabinose transferase-like glycosyltransferase
MSAADPVETGRDRAALTREAGIGKLSFISVLAGVLVAYGAFAVLAALAAAAAAAIGLKTDLSANNWAELGVGSAIVAAVALLLAYLFGGYVAGRMARRAGLIHGLAVFILALVIVALIAAIAATQTDTSAIRGNLRSLGIPTTGAEWSDVGTLAGIGSLVAMLVGALLGGMLGERWHTKLARRAASPKYGPDRDQPTADDRAAATAPTREADDRDPAERDRAERGQSDGGGATRIDQDRPQT